MTIKSGRPVHADWENIGNNHFVKNGWTVWTTGFCWKVKNPEGYVYSAEYAAMDIAIRNAEKKMK